MTKTSTTKPSIFNSIITVFERYHLTIFTVVIVGGLSTAVLLLNAILVESSDTSGYTSTLENTSFDQVTINRVTQLKLSSDTSLNFTLPSGRISPFAE